MTHEEEACTGNLREVLAFFLTVSVSDEECSVDQGACKEAIPSRAEPKIKSAVKALSNLRKC